MGAAGSRLHRPVHRGQNGDALSPGLIPVPL